MAAQPTTRGLGMRTCEASAPLVTFLLLVGCTTTALRTATPASLALQPAPVLEQPSPGLDAGRAPLTAFLRDTALILHLRTFYFDGTQNTDAENEAWAGGGWLSSQSGWLLDTLALGATLYGSAPFYAPADKDGTILLAPGQQGYYALGEAWGALRYEDYAFVKGYRQLVDQGYINPSDIRMTPYTFEGVTIRGKVGVVQYLAGYLWKIKPRNAATFVSMAEQAGATGKQRRGRLDRGPVETVVWSPHRRQQSVRRRHLQYRVCQGGLSLSFDRRLGDRPRG